MDLVKTCNFSRKLPCFDVSMHYSARSCKNCLISWKSTKTHRFGKNYATFANKLPCFGVSMNFSAKGSKKWLNSWQSRKNHRFVENFPTFRTNYHVFGFPWTFQEKVAKSASFREKPPEIIDLAKTLQLFERTTMSLHFDELFRKKLQKVPHFVKKHEKSWIWLKLATFQEKVAKSASFREKARETIDLAKTFNFSRKLPCLGIFMNFSARSCKKCLISWKTTRNHRFGQNFATFRTNYHVFAFWWTFQKKVAKSASFREKTWEIIDLAKTSNFSGKSCKKCLISWKSTRNHRFGQNFQLFEQTTMSWHFHELFSKKLQKVPHSVEKHEKSSIWPKLCNFFEQTTMSLHFDQLFGKKLKKVPHFVKQHEKSLIWPKPCNFWNKLQCLFPFDELSRKKLQKVRRLVKKHEKSSIWPKLATFRANYHVSAFWWRSESFREKARKIVDLAKTNNFSNKLPCFGVLVSFSAKSCKKYCRSISGTSYNYGVRDLNLLLSPLPQLR